MNPSVIKTCLESLLDDAYNYIEDNQDNVEWNRLVTDMERELVSTVKSQVLEILKVRLDVFNIGDLEKGRDGPVINFDKNEILVQFLKDVLKDMT